MTDRNPSEFSKQGILEKQKAAKEDYEKKIQEMRQTFEQVAGTPSGLKMLKYLFLICGTEVSPIRKTKEGVVDTNETLLVLGTRSIWEHIRFNFTSETLKKVERHFWEDLK